MRLSTLLLVLAVLLSVASSSAFGEGFYIFSLPKGAEPPLGPDHLLVAGGFANGLERGMTGNIYSYGRDRDSFVVGTGEILDVRKFEARCLIRPADVDVAGQNLKIFLEPAPASKDFFIQRGEQAFDNGDFEGAEYFLSKVLQSGTPEDSTRFVPLVEKSRLEVETEAKRKLTKKEKKQEAKRQSVYMALVQHHMYGASLTPAKYYLSKILRVNPKHKLAKTIVERIDEVRRYNGEHPDEVVMGSDGFGADSAAKEIYPIKKKHAYPKYPIQEKRAGIEGTVWVKALVAKTGKVLWAETQESSGNLGLDSAAIITAYEVEYEPGRQGNKVVNCWVCSKTVFDIGW